MEIDDTFTILLPLLIPFGLIMYCGIVSLKWVTETKITVREHMKHQITVKKIHEANRGN